jgi:hypothetical protein
MADFSWNAESEKLASICLLIVPRDSPVAFGNRKGKHIQPVRSKEKVKNWI